MTRLAVCKICGKQFWPTDLIDGTVCSRACLVEKKWDRFSLGSSFDSVLEAVDAYLRKYENYRGISKLDGVGDTIRLLLHAEGGDIALKISKQLYQLSKEPAEFILRAVLDHFHPMKKEEGNLIRRGEW